MILAVLAFASAGQAVPAPAPAGGDSLRPEVQAAFDPARLAWLVCLRRHADAARRSGRRANREAALDASFTDCEADENAMRTALRRQYNQESVDRLMVELRRTVRAPMRDYLRR